MNPKKDDRNTIKRYVFKQEQLDYDSDCDLLEAIIINLGEEKDGNYAGILKMLGTLFSVRMTIEEKKRILEKDFNLTLTIHEESEVTNMCTFSDAVEQMAIERGLKKGMLQGMQQGIQQGLQKGKFESICNLMSTFHLDIYQSMEALMIPKEDYEIYITLLKEM